MHASRTACGARVMQMVQAYPHPACAGGWLSRCAGRLASPAPPPTLAWHSEPLTLPASLPTAPCLPVPCLPAHVVGWGAHQRPTGAQPPRRLHPAGGVGPGLGGRAGGGAAGPERQQLRRLVPGRGGGGGCGAAGAAAAAAAGRAAQPQPRPAWGPHCAHTHSA